MASKTVTLKNNNGDQIHPKTKANAVFLEDGQSVENKFKTIGQGFSGSYNDLTDKPELFSGSYNDLTDKPDSSKIFYNNENSQLNSINIQDAIDEIMLLKGANNGFAGLDSTGKVPSDQLPSMDYIPTNQRGATNGVAALDSSTKVPSSQLPISTSTSSSSTTTVASSSAVKDAYDLANSANSTASSAKTTATAAMPKSGGTFTGTVKAGSSSSSQEISTLLLRNSKLSDIEETPSQVGSICWQIQ